MLRVRAFSEKHTIALGEMCFMGDDVNDIGAMEFVGLAAAPANGPREVLSHAAFIKKRTGGDGAVRELIDALIVANLAAT